MNPFFERAWADLGEDPAHASRIESPNRPVPLPSSMAVGDLAAGSVAAASLALELFRSGRGTGLRRAGSIVLRPERIAAAFRSERLFLWNDRPPAAWAPLSGFWPAADGWVRTHANYPHHEARLRDVLSLSSIASPDEVAAAISSWSASDLETRSAESGAVVAAVRTPAQWAATPQAEAIAQRPLVDLETLPSAGRPRARLAPAEAPLAGIRVLDLTRVIAGPIATRTLALAGADVLRIDSPALPEIPWQYLDTGQGKRSAVLDFRDHNDLATFHTLLAAADVLVTGYRPGSLDRFGLNPMKLAERHPHLVFGSVNAWGGTGPWARRRGFDSIVQATIGIADRERGTDGTPGALPAQALDHSAGYLLAASIVSALRRLHDENVVSSSEVSLARIGHELVATTAPSARLEIPDLESETVTGNGPAGSIRCAGPCLAYEGAPTTFSGIGNPWAANSPTWLG